MFKRVKFPIDDGIDPVKLLYDSNLWIFNLLNIKCISSTKQIS